MSVPGLVLWSEDFSWNFMDYFIEWQFDYFLKPFISSKGIKITGIPN